MPLSQNTVTLIRESWAVLARNPEAFTAAFYDELFRSSPQYRPMFAGIDLSAQRRKLAAALALVVRSADDLAPVLDALKEMGRRHAGYGVRESDYDSVAAALLITIERQLGDVFSPAIRNAWAEAYHAVASTMLVGAASVRTTA